LKFFEMLFEMDHEFVCVANKNEQGQAC